MTVEDDMVEERRENIDRLCYNGIKLLFLSCLQKKNEDIKKKKKKESAHLYSSANQLLHQNCTSKLIWQNFNMI